MTEEELASLKCDTAAQQDAQFIVEAWESRFPDVLDESSRFLLYWFTHDTIEHRIRLLEKNQ